jgi:hypothetical protein
MFYSKFLSQITFLWATDTNSHCFVKIMKVFVIRGALQTLKEKNVSIECHILNRSYTLIDKSNIC